MLKSRKLLAEALRQLSIACDMLQLNYPTIEVDMPFMLALSKELNYIEMNKVGLSCFGIPFKKKDKNDIHYPY